jgi:hypothetical protein
VNRRSRAPGAAQAHNIAPGNVALFEMYSALIGRALLLTVSGNSRPNTQLLAWCSRRAGVGVCNRDNPFRGYGSCRSDSVFACTEHPRTIGEQSRTSGEHTREIDQQHL